MSKFEEIMNAFAKFGIFFFYFLYVCMLQKMCDYLHTDLSTFTHILK